MSLPDVARACSMLALTAALTAACGDDRPSAAPTTTTTTSVTVASASSTTAAPAATTTTTVDDTRTIDVAFAGGQVTGGVRTETVRLGDKVRLRVTSDVAEEVHVHTYDAVVDVAAGQTAELEFTATIPGRHDVELEKKGRHLLVLEVR